MFTGAGGQEGLCLKSGQKAADRKLNPAWISAGGEHAAGERGRVEAEEKKEVNHDM